MKKLSLLLVLVFSISLRVSAAAKAPVPLWLAELETIERPFSEHFYAETKLADDFQKAFLNFLPAHPATQQALENKAKLGLPTKMMIDYRPSDQNQGVACLRVEFRLASHDDCDSPNFSEVTTSVRYRWSQGNLVLTAQEFIDECQRPAPPGPEELLVQAE